MMSPLCDIILAASGTMHSAQQKPVAPMRRTGRISGFSGRRIEAMEERRRIAVVIPKYGLVGGLRGNARERMGREALQK